MPSLLVPTLFVANPFNNFHQPQNSHETIHASYCWIHHFFYLVTFACFAQQPKAGDQQGVQPGQSQVGKFNGHDSRRNPARACAHAPG